MATQSQEENDEEEALLVSEFPPPPYYYHKAASLVPPPIPKECFERAAKKAAAVAAAAAAAAEAERLRLSGKTSGIDDTTAKEIPKIEDIDEDGEVVAVFGEIVEDPLLVQVEDDCQDPSKIRDTICRLKKEVMQGFVKLVNELVHNPLDNKKCRDELSHNVFLMIQECNKYREHQAREILIDILEKQLRDRQKAIRELKEETSKADEALEKIKSVMS